MNINTNTNTNRKLTLLEKANSNIILYKYE